MSWNELVLRLQGVADRLREHIDQDLLTLLLACLRPVASLLLVQRALLRGPLLALMRHRWRKCGRYLSWWRLLLLGGWLEHLLHLVHWLLLLGWRRWYCTWAEIAQELGPVQFAMHFVAFKTFEMLHQALMRCH